MEYLIGAIVAGIIIFVVLVKSKTDKFNKLTRMHFPNWFALFSNSQMPENHGMARALILQTFHLAEEFGAITPDRETRTRRRMHEGRSYRDSEWVVGACFAGRKERIWGC